jgi:hypothetical protein
MPRLRAPWLARLSASFRALSRCFAKARAYISRREVKVFGVEIFLYEWTLTAKRLCNRQISKLKIFYFSK